MYLSKESAEKELEKKLEALNNGELVMCGKVHIGPINKNVKEVLEMAARIEAEITILRGLCDDFVLRCPREVLDVQVKTAAEDDSQK